MRAQDIQMAATINVESRTIMVSGAIDRNDYTIVLRIPVPEPGLWTVTKAEVNLTDSSWYCWQITLGEGISVATGDPSSMLMSRQFRKCKFIPERGAIMFYDGEVRPGDAIFKIARLQITGTYEIVLSHSRGCRIEDVENNVKYGFGDDLPKIEVIAPVRNVEPGDIDIASFSSLALQGV